MIEVATTAVSTQAFSARYDYVLRIPYGDGTIDLSVDDRIYAVSKDVLINESRMSKFGFDVGRIILTIIRHPE